MQGAKLIDHDIIESNNLEAKQSKKRPTTSGFRGGGDRLPSRATKTRKIQMGNKNKLVKKEK